MKKIIKRRHAALMAGVCIRQIQGLIETDGFPKPVTVGKSEGWIDTEVQAWIDKKIAERDAEIAGGVA